MEDCLFCKMASGEVKAEKVYEDEKVFAILDIKPAGRLSGHTLLISKKHCTSISECEDDALASVFGALKMLVPAVKKASGAEGINVLRNEGQKAGELIPHLHFHIIPRGEGDGISFDENRRPASEEELENARKKIKKELG